MPRGDKSKYTGKQIRKAEAIAGSYEERGVPSDEAVSRAWATVNKNDGGGKKPGGSGRRKPTDHRAADHRAAEHLAAERGVPTAGETAAHPRTDRSAAARKAAATRKRNAEQRTS